MQNLTARPASPILTATAALAATLTFVAAPSVAAPPRDPSSQLATVSGLAAWAEPQTALGGRCLAVVVAEHVAHVLAPTLV